jgi:hypothetical protein
LAPDKKLWLLKMQQLILHTGTAIWQVTEPDYMLYNLQPFFTLMLSVAMLNVIILNVVAPLSKVIITTMVADGA